MLIPKNNNWVKGERKRTIGREVKIGPMSLKFATIVLVAIVALFYLAQSAQASSQKYQIMQLTSSKQDIEAQGKDLEVQAARLKSLNEIKQSTQNQGLEPIGDASFSQPNNPNHS